MKAWKKTPPKLLAAFDKAVPTTPSVTRRPMFGYASAFANGNMFAGTLQDAIVVRLAETDHAALLKVQGATPFEPMGRPIKEYVVVPSSIVAEPRELAESAQKKSTAAKQATAKESGERKTATRPRR